LNKRDTFRALIEKSDWKRPLGKLVINGRKILKWNLEF
jgi:hypothetical protein